MSFESPYLLAGLLAVPLVLLFGLWRTRPQVCAVPSLRIWGRLAERNPPVRELRRPAFHASLILQAVAAAFLVVGLAGPYARVPSARPRALFLLLDDSASLAARDGTGRTRWDLAREAVRDLVAQADAGDRIVLATGHSGSGPGRRYDGPPSGVQAHLDSLVPSGCGEEAVVRAARLLAAECGTGPGRMLRVVSDHAAPDVAAAVKPAGGRIRTVGEAVRNTGIVAFSGEPAATGRLDVFLSCLGPAGGEAEVELSDSPDGTSWRRLEVLRIPLDRRGEGALVRGIEPGADSRLLRARLTAPDALEADDIARLVRVDEGAQAVCHVARPGPLVKALQSIPGLRVEIRTAAPGRPVPFRSGPRLQVFDGVVPERLPEGAWVVLSNPPAPVGPFEVEEDGPAAVEAWRMAPPLTDHVDLPAIAVRRAKRCRLADGFGGAVRVILESRDRGPLLAWWDRAGGGVVYVGFDLAWRGDPGADATAWSRDPGFPIFWKNVADAALGGAPPSGGWMGHRTCAPAGRWGAEVGARRAREGGGAFDGSVPAGPSGVAAHVPGVVYVEGAGGRVPSAAFNLFDATETACPSGGGAEGDRLPPATEEFRPRSLAGVCAAAAGILLAAAWGLAARSR